jgi:hypothetical protein
MYGIIQKFHIRLIASAHIIALITFINEHHKMLETISQVHTVTMRHRYVFHIPLANPAVYCMDVYHTVIISRNTLPLKNKRLSDNSNQFKIIIKKFLMTHFTHSVQKYTLLGKD